jgi:outer membrane protein TolC
VSDDVVTRKDWSKALLSLGQTVERKAANGYILQVLINVRFKMESQQMPKIIIYTLILVSPLTLRTLGEELRFSLKEAVQIALENNHEIKAFKSSVSAGKSDISIARSTLLPQITFQEKFIRTDNPTSVFSFKLNQQRFSQSDFEISSLNNPNPISDFETSLSFEQPILVIRDTLGIRTAKNEFLAQGEDLARKKEELAFRVVQSYVMVQTAKEFVNVAERALEDAKEHLRIANARFKKGLGLFSDTLRASTAVTEAEQELISARKDMSVAKRELGLLLGMSESVDTDADIQEIPLKEIDYYKDESLSRHDIRSLELRYENAKTNVRIAEAGYLPTFGVRGSYQLNDHNAPFGGEGDSWSVMAFLRWNLFDGARREYERAKAKHKVKEAEERLSGLKKAVSFEVYEAYLGVEEARKNLELAESALKTAEEGRRLVRIRYENSLSPLVDLLDAQLNLDRARANFTAKKNEYHLAIARLGFASGTILQDLEVEE